ncbi:MAG: DnaB-like helicase C-terminal domain-containing protein [Elusimicrobiota bacterium]
MTPSTTDQSPIEVQAKLEENLVRYNGEDAVVSSTEMRAILKNRQRSEVRFRAGIPGLDDLVDGFEGGELVALSGPTKHGKTLLAQTLTVKFAEQGINSLWISFEVPMPQFLKQMPDSCEFYLPKLLRPHNATWLDDRILESKLKDNVRAVFIDHLHYLVDLAKGGRNISVDIGQVVRGLKRTAVRHNLVLFLLCHATKALTEKGEQRELGAFDIRDSSFVPQEADSTWVIMRRKDRETDEFNNRATLKVCNHRRTGVMERRVILEKRGLLFEQAYEPGEEPIIIAGGPVADGGDGGDSIPF